MNEVLSAYHKHAHCGQDERDADAMGRLTAIQLVDAYRHCAGLEVLFFSASASIDLARSQYCLPFRKAHPVKKRQVVRPSATPTEGITEAAPQPFMTTEKTEITGGSSSSSSNVESSVSQPQSESSIPVKTPKADPQKDPEALKNRVEAEKATEKSQSSVNSESSSRS